MNPSISPTAPASSATPALPPLPWWRFGHVWLVLAGPLVVIVAGFVTLWLAIRSPDPVVAEDYYRRGLNINRTLESGDRARLPAVRGRNHAATPSVAPSVMPSNPAQPPAPGGTQP